MSDKCFPEIPIDSYIERLKGHTKRIPLAVNFEITHRCNNRCTHCFVNKPLDDPAEKASELSLQEIRSLLDTFADHGCLWLLLTGGEPLVREDFADIYVYAKQKGFLITVFTNGTLIDSNLCYMFREYPPRAVEISLYGATRTTFERVTRSLGSFQRCMSGIHQLLENRIPLKLKTMLMTLNKHEFFKMKDLARSFDSDLRFDALINARIDGKRDLNYLRLSPSEVLEFDKTDPRRKDEFQRLFQRSSKWLGRHKNFIYKCSAGINSFHLDPHGKMSLCTMARIPSYDLRKGTFEEGWFQFLPKVREQTYRKSSPCEGCNLSAICDQCPGWALLEYGDPESRLEYLCELARLRSAAYGIS